MRRNGTLGTALAILLGPAGLVWPAGHEPAPSLALKSPGVSSERQKSLSELWERRILAADATQWSPEDMALMLRLRNAEHSGALGLLKRRFYTLKGFTVIHKSAQGPSEIRLTKEGYDRYLATKSQEAMTYFETKLVDAKWVFKLRDEQDRPMFDGGSGMLTESGDAVYTRATLNLPVYWKLPSGEVMGNRPPKRYIGVSP